MPFFLSQENNLDGKTAFRLPMAGVWDNDGNGHGTHCAGIIGAIGDNGKGVVGVRKDPNLFSFFIGKGLSDAGSGLTSNIMKAVGGCYDSGAKVISMSLGGGGYSEIEDFVYDFLYDEGFLVVAAAGNSGNSDHSYPASYKAVVSVAAVDSNMKRASFSQYNDQIELSGPGVDILSTYPGNKYRKLSGTSMACPHVAGVAAEVWSHFPDCTNNQIRNILIRTAKDLGAQGYDLSYGYGLVQAKAAYDLLKSDGCDAGGPVQDPLSEGAKGGCEQDPNQNIDCSDIPSVAGRPLLLPPFVSLGVLLLSWFFLA